MRNIQKLPDTPPIIVIGMHRSGTSLVSQILSELGVYIGIELDSHFESVCFKKINRQLLYDHGAHWANPDPFIYQLRDQKFLQQNVHEATELLGQEFEHYGKVSRGQSWGWKDPRNTITLPIWLKLFPDAKVIHVIRNGIDVALSVARREMRRYRRCNPSEKRMFPPTIARAYKLWETYLDTGLNLQTRYTNCITVTYENLIQQPNIELNMLCQFLHITPNPEVQEHIARKIIKYPTKRSTIEQLRVRFLLKIINPSTLIALGYTPD